MRGKIKGGLVVFVFLGLIIASIVSALLQKDPIEITASFGCIGTSYCLVGEVMNVKIKLNPNNEEVLNRNKGINIVSSAIQGDKVINSTLIGTETQLSIPLKVDLIEGKYKIEITSDLIKAGGFLDWIKYIIYDKFGHKYSYSQDIKIRYPIIKPEEEGYKCQDNGVYIEEVKLKLEDTFSEFECKIRIKTNKFVTTEHLLVTEHQLDEYFHYYDTNLTKINKLDLTGSIQKITFTAHPSLNQIDISIMPVCLISGNEISITKYETKLKTCEVNKKPLLERISSLF